VTAATTPPSIAARRISFRLGGLAGWAFSEIGDRYATHGKISEMFEGMAD